MTGSRPPAAQRRLAAASVVMLLLWLALWYGFAAPPEVLSPVLVVGLLWIPWLPVLPALLRGRLKGCRWGSIISVLYAGLALTELIANPQAQLWAAVALGLSLVVMFVLIRYARRWSADIGAVG